MAVVLALGACTERVAVGPEGRFSWEPQSQMVWPVEGAIVSAFGDSARPDHRGIDLAARPGEPVAAALLGRTEFVGEMPGYGNVVVLSHGDGLSTVYAHLGAVRVHEGEAVSRGQTIGRVAAGGYLHYEIRRAKEVVDPAKFYAIAPRPVIGGSVYVEKSLAAEPAGVGVPIAAETAAAAPPRTSVPGGRPESRAEASTAPEAAPPPGAARGIHPERIPTPLASVPGAVSAEPVEAPAGSAPTASRTASPAPPSPAPPVAAADRERTGASIAPAAAPPPALPAARDQAAPAGAAEGEGSVGMGAAVIGANLVYMPAKFAYAGVGVLTGGVVLLLAHDVDVASDVWRPTLGGDYLVTERHLRGESRLHFLGAR